MAVKKAIFVVFTSVSLVMSLAGVFSYTRGRAIAATNNNLNFQGRLLSNTGNTVADGSYNIEFNLYTQQAPGGTTEWTEDYLNNVSQGVTVKNGYFSVNLGSLTNFPTTIAWDQQQWLGMTIRGTGSCSFGTCSPADTEMTPRFKLTAVPYAFRAAKLMDSTNTNSFTADDLIQVAPGTPQVVSAALAAISLNQTSSGGLLQLQKSGADKFTVDNSGNVVAAGTASVQGASISVGAASLAGGLILNDGSSNTGTLQTTALGTNRTYTFPDADGVVCLTTTCSGAAGGFVQNGNSFTGLATLGTNDNYNLAFETNNTTYMTLDTSGNLGLGVSTVNSALQIDKGTGIASALKFTANGTTGQTSGDGFDLGITASGAAEIRQHENLGLALYTNNTNRLDIAANGLVSIAQGLSLSNGLNNNTGGITNAGPVSGVSTLSLSGAISGGTTYTGSGTINTTGGTLQTNSVDRIDNSGNLVNIGNLTAAGGLTIASSGSGDITLNSASNKLVIDPTDTTLQRVAAGSYTFDFSDTGDTTLVLNNSGSGVANLNLNDGNLQIGGTTVLTSGRVLQNVTIDAGVVTTGILSNNRGGTGLDTSSAANGKLLIGNGTGFSLANLVDNGGITISNGAGTLGLAVAYGSSSNTAVQGNVTLICPSGSGNLTGGGTTITLGSGGTCGSLSTNNAVTFSTSVTSPSFTGTGAVTLSSGGAAGLTLDSASNVLTIAANDTALERIASGTYTFDLKDGADTTLALTNSGAGNANFSADGSVTAGNGLTVTTGGASITGATSVLGDTTVQTTADSTTAFRLRNSDGDNLVRIDTTGDNQNNLFTNDSFETNITGWTAKGTTPTTFAQDTANGYEGNDSLKVTTQATNDQGAKYAIAGGLSLSTRYSLSFYIKLDPTSNTMATLAAGYSSDGSTDNTACTLNTSTVVSSGWTRINCSFTTPSSFSNVPYVYIKQTDNVVHTFYIDGALLQTDTNTENNFRDGKVSIQGTVVSPLILQNATNSTNALAVQNAAGTNIFSIDTTDTNTMITNPGFELGVSGWVAEAGTTTIQRDTSQSWLGNASLQVATSNTANTGAKYVTANTQPTQLAISSTYTLSWYAKLSSGTFNDIIARYDRDGSGAGAAANCTGINTQTVVAGGWTRYSCLITTDGTTPAADAYIDIVQVAAPGSSRTFYIDGVQLEGGASATEYGAGTIFINGTVTSPVSFKNKSNSTTEFSVQNAASASLFQVDSLNNRLYIGSTTSDSTAVLLVLDSYNLSTDPTNGVDGGEYYNSATETFRCYRDGQWETCGTNPIERAYVFQDEFISGTTASGGIGMLNWTSSTITGAPTYSYNNGTAPVVTADRPGILRLTTPGTANRGGTMQMNQTAGTPSTALGVGQIVKFAVAPGSVITSQVIRIGLHNETTATLAPSTGVWWEYDQASSANWRYCYTNAGPTPICVASSVAVAATTFASLEIRINSLTVNASSIDFYINGTKINVSGAITVNTTNLISPALTCYTTNGTAKDVNIDYFQFTSVSSAQR